MDLIVEIDGQQTKLDQCVGLQRYPCGCVAAAAVAVVEGEGGWSIATPEQARQHFEPNPDSRDRDAFTYELITMTRYRTDLRNGWECAAHEPKLSA